MRNEDFLRFFDSLRACLDRNNRSGQMRDNGAAVAASRTNNKHIVTSMNVERLNKPRQNHRLH